jgi:ParB family chromosome partitioning protein
MIDTTSIPLNKLTAWDGNVRKTAGADTALAELAASIAAHGLLQSLVVRNGKKGSYAVVAGGRRLAALRQLAKDGKIADDYPVPCQVLAAEADATEISLAENAVRERMHPADEFEAFRELVDKGTPVEDIAARFGVTPRTVEQRLKLARVSPVVIEAFRAGDLNLSQVMAFAVSDDHAAQERVFGQLDHSGGEPEDIRAALTEDEISARDRRVKFVSLKAYEKAGGGVRRDLFAEGDDGVFILDPAILDQLAAKKLEKAAKEVTKEGWKWVEIRQHYDWSEWNDFGRVHPEAAPLTPELQDELDKLNAEYEAICEIDGDLTSEQEARADAITARCDELEDRPREWQPQTLAIAGAVVSIGHDGKTDVTRGLVRPEDGPKKKVPKNIERTNEDGSVETVEVKETTLSAPLTESLTAHRSAIIAAALHDEPEIALAALVHTMALQVVYDGYSRETCLKLTASAQSLHRVEQSTAYEVLGRAHSQWGDQLPGDPAHLFAWCLKQDRDTLLSLTAYCVACTVNTVLVKGERPDSERFIHADALVKALDIDFATWFKPTAENYFGRISKPAILDALKEAKGGAIAPAWEKAKKGDLAAIAEREIDGTGWLPVPLRIAA